MTCDIKFRFLLTSGNISDERMPNNQLDEKSIVYHKNTSYVYFGNCSYNF